MIFYVKKRTFLGLTLVPEPFAGYAIGPVAFILEKYRDDTGLRAHEQKHIDDFWAAHWKTIKGWWTNDREWRLRSEVRAYAVQCLDSDNPISVYKASTFIATRYGLNLQETTAYLLLRQQITKIAKGLA